jgi:hypothetical protein
MPRRAVLEAKPWPASHRAHSLHQIRLSMRCRRVGANVSPMRAMLSLALMLIKPALLS